MSTFVSSHCSTAHNKKTSITHNLAKIGLGKEHSWDYNWCCCIMCIGKTNDPFSSTWPFLEYITDETGCLCLFSKPCSNNKYYTRLYLHNEMYLLIIILWYIHKGETSITVPWYWLFFWSRSLKDYLGHILTC